MQDLSEPVAVSMLRKDACSCRKQQVCVVWRRISLGILGVFRRISEKES